ncbi:hypothetical protein SUGI_0357290 [Cryptomeria japonica]|nr:hypothetical protein SUGI_0357290 [Cryptomeria japonica]
MLAEATENFHYKNKLGHGGFGAVYKGITRNGDEIAVKKLSANSVQGNKEFMNEVKLVANVQHRNLAKLLGCCAEGSESLLAYEYFPNKSLDTFLFEYAMRGQLSIKVDIYSFGVVVLEIISGRKNTDTNLPHRMQNLLEWLLCPLLSDLAVPASPPPFRWERRCLALPFGFPPRCGSGLGWPSNAPMAFAPPPAVDSGWPYATTSKFPRLALGSHLPAGGRRN